MAAKITFFNLRIESLTLQNSLERAENYTLLMVLYTVGKHTPCGLSFVYTSQAKLTVRNEPRYG